MGGTMAELHFELLHLPLELKRRVASFLKASEAINMARSCRTLHTNLSLARLERPLFTAFGRQGDVRTGEHWYRAFRLPVLNRRVHSMDLRFFWRDQGWGNRKTKTCVVGYPASASSEIPNEFASFPFRGGRVVASSPDCAEHHETRLKLSFNPVENEVYHLWYKVGGGGGHEMQLREGCLRTVIFDDVFRNFTRNYRILCEEGVLCREVERETRRAPLDNNLFFPRMLIRVSRALRRQLQQQREMGKEADQRILPEDELEALFAEYSIPLNLGSLVAVEEIVQADIEERVVCRNDVQPEGDDTSPADFGRPIFPREFNQLFLDAHDDDDDISADDADEDGIENGNVAED